MVGDALMVCPVLESEASQVEINFPGDQVASFVFTVAMVFTEKWTKFRSRKINSSCTARHNSSVFACRKNNPRSRTS